MPLLALLLALLCIAAGGCGGGGGKGQIDLEDYGRALAALRESEGDGQLHAARLDGGDITFDLVREGPATRVRWTGSELEDTDDDVFAGEGRTFVSGPAGWGGGSSPAGRPCDVDHNYWGQRHNHLPVDPNCSGQRATGVRPAPPPSRG